MTEVTALPSGAVRQKPRGLEGNGETDLLHKISEPSYLEKKAWLALNRSNPSSHGLDCESVADFSRNLHENISKISSTLRKGSYRFQPARGTTIPKPGKSERRPLRIFNVRDRLVQKAILLQIESYFPEVENPVSFAFIKEQSVRRAVDAVTSGARRGYKFILLADIKSFFEALDRHKLHDEIMRRLPDNSLGDLIGAAIETDIGNRGDLLPEEVDLFPTSSKGVAQGSILSPFLSNVFMIPFDQFLIQNELYAVRYADDLAVLSMTRAEAERIHASISDFLRRERGLELYPLHGRKASKIVPLNGGFDFLGIRFEMRRKKWHLEPAPAKRKEIAAEIRRWTSPQERWPLLDRMVVLSRKFEGWMRCYKDVCSTRSFAKEMDALFVERVHTLLRSRGFIQDGSQLTRAQVKFLGIQRSVRSRKRAILLPEGLKT